MCVGPACILASACARVCGQVDDMVASNALLYSPGEHPDHCVVIKYVPAVGDSKRAMDEYSSEIFMGGCSTIVLHNTCEDSLLAAPIILDLVILAELLTRIQARALPKCSPPAYCRPALFMAQDSAWWHTPCHMATWLRWGVHYGQSPNGLPGRMPCERQITLSQVHMTVQLRALKG